MIGPYVIFADDDPDDLELITGYFHDYSPGVPAVELGNGSEVLHFLRTLTFNDALPLLVVLDINMPRLNGKETLLAIRTDPRLSLIPVLLYSTSLGPADESFCEKHQASWVRKPSTLDGIRDTARIIADFCAHHWK
jgi:CheY-like chemotaxis protein